MAFVDDGTGAKVGLVWRMQPVRVDSFREEGTNALITGINDVGAPIYYKPTDNPRNIVGVMNIPRFVSVYGTGTPHDFGFYGWSHDRQSVKRNPDQEARLGYTPIRFDAVGPAMSAERWEATMGRDMTFFKKGDVHILTDADLKSAGIDPDGDQAVSADKINLLVKGTGKSRDEPAPRPDQEGAPDQPEKETPGFIDTDLPVVPLPQPDLSGFNDLWLMLLLLGVGAVLVGTKD